MKLKSYLTSWSIIFSVFIFSLFCFTSCGSDPTGGVNLNAPTNLQAVAISSTQIDLTWSDNFNNEDGFKVERKTGVDGSYSEIASVVSNTTTYPDTNGLLSDTEYCYRVRAFNNRGNSAYSNENCISTLISSDNIPNDPTNLQAVVSSSTQIDLTWSDNSNNEDGFKIERKDGTDGTYIKIADVVSDTTTYSDTNNLKVNIEYSYRVMAYNSNGDSSNSNEARTIIPTSLGKGIWGEYNGPGSGNDRAVALTIDGFGNIYVTGESAGPGTGNDYVTIKYATNGTEMWRVRYNGPGNSTDTPHGITVDGSGNVYITGESAGSGTGNDYATIKYDLNGKLVWVKRYNGPGNSTDIARAISVDGSGNVYVTGESSGLGTGSDYATVKYDTYGNEVWMARHDGTGNSADIARAITVDGSGNVYITGESAGSGTGNDYVTIKYALDGKLVWVKRYNGPGNGADIARAISVDGTGNVYVTGESTGSGTGYDYATIKYDTNGNQIWTEAARYNGPGKGSDMARAISVDGTGNVYVTGESVGAGTGYDYATIKYDTNGNQIWTEAARYNGPGSGNDRVIALVVDNNGNVYVTGESVGAGTGYDYATIKYDTNGNQIWTEAARYNGPGSGNDHAVALFIDNNGNVYVTGESAGTDTGYDYYTVKYDSDGKSIWDITYNGPGWGNDRAVALGIDSSGNVYVTGESAGPGTGSDYAIIKYKPGGDKFWERRYNGPGWGNDRAVALVIDSNGNVYVTGESAGAGTDTDYATIKYDPNGKLVEGWPKRYNGPDNGKDIARDIVVDGDENIFVTGESLGSSTGADYTTIKYDSSGNEVWVKRFDGPANASDIARAIDIDASGNVYVTGESTGSGTGSDYTTIKYDPDGNKIWEARYNGPGNSSDIARAIDIDASGNVYVTGESTGSGTGSDYTTIKYDPDGNKIWEARYNGPGNSSDIARAIDIDASGNVYVTGESTGSGTGSDYATIKYDTSGNEVWVKRFDGSVKGNDIARDFALDKNGNVYVTGESNSGLSIDYITVKYDSNGNYIWVSRYNGLGWGDDRAAAIALDSSGNNIYVTGESIGSGTGYDYVTVKYTP